LLLYKSRLKNGNIHSVKSYQLIEHQGFEGKGRSKKDQAATKTEYQVIAEMAANTDKINLEKASEGHYVIVNYLNFSLGDQHHQGIEGVTALKKNSTAFWTICG